MKDLFQKLAISKEDFIENYYEKKYLIKKGSFKSIINIKDIDGIFYKNNIKYPAIRLYKGAEELV